MSSDTLPAVEARGLGKEYALGQEHWAYGSLAENLTRLARRPGAVVRRLVGRDPDRPTTWALRDLDLDVHRGEVLGVVGANGAGKTTLLRILARVTAPTEGRFTLRGRAASLLSVGTGFHYELTGRENVYLSGTILGMRKREIDRRFDEIVAFSGVERFLDTPVKRYSAGMFVRLGFAVAAHLDAEILLVDEVLAVGDAAFRKKCVGTMNDVALSGRTIVFVSHDMGAIQQLATRAILLDRGRVAAEGRPSDIVGQYLHVATRPAFRAETTTGRPQVLSVSLGDGTSRAQPLASEPIVVRLTYRLLQPAPGIDLGLTVLGRDGLPVFETSPADVGLVPADGPGEHSCAVTLPAGLLLPGDHHLGVTLRDASGEVVERLEPVVSFTLIPGMSTPGNPWVPRRGVVAASCRWQLDPDSTGIRS